MPLSLGQLTLTRAWLIGTTAVGFLDGAFAVGRAALRGIPAQRVGQGIAAALIGKPAYDGGAMTGWLGVLLHFVIAGGVVAVFLVASRRLRFLVSAPSAWGGLYGMGVFVVMNFVVIPLSAITMPARSLVQMLPGVLIHIVGVGWPAALVAAAVPLTTQVPNRAA
ncbi:MAG: hypothetical protein ABI742_15245 [Gemmatimonadota bacterium]